MTTQQNISEMKCFICDTLDSTGRYVNIEPNFLFEADVVKDAQLRRDLNSRRRNQILVWEKDNENGEGEAYVVYCHALKLSNDDHIKKLRALHLSGLMPVNVFYRGDPFFNRQTGQHGTYLGRNYRRKSINTAQEEYDVIRISDLEKRAANFGPIIYYQPETLRLQKALRLYIHQKVIFDYSHSENDFARSNTGNISKSFKEMREIGNLEDHFALDTMDDKDSVIRNELRLYSFRWQLNCATFVPE